MTSTWTPLGIDTQSKVRTCFGAIYDLGAGGAVTEVQAGTGISVDDTDPSAPIVANAGVLSVAASTGITVGGTAQNPTIANAGVLSVAAGTGISVGGTAQNPSVANSGVLSVAAGGNIAVGGTAQNPSVALASPLTGPISVTGDFSASGITTIYGLVTDSLSDTTRVSSAGSWDSPVAVAVTAAGGYAGSTAATSARRGVVRITNADTLPVGEQLIITVPTTYGTLNTVMKTYSLFKSGDVDLSQSVSGAVAGANALIFYVTNVGGAPSVAGTFTVAWEAEVWNV